MSNLAKKILKNYFRREFYFSSFCTKLGLGVYDKYHYRHCPIWGGEKHNFKKVAAGGLFNFSVSMTTRAPRAGEIDGKDYFCI